MTPLGREANRGRSRRRQKARAERDPAAAPGWAVVGPDHLSVRRGGSACIFVAAVPFAIVAAILVPWRFDDWRVVAGYAGGAAVFALAVFIAAFWRSEVAVLGPSRTVRRRS